MIKAQLITPIQSFGKIITQIVWNVSYPNNLLYYQLQTADGFVMKDGNWIVPNEIINTWALDDTIISNAVINAEPWNIQEVTPFSDLWKK